MLAGARRALMNNARTQRFKKRPDRFQDVGFSAHHNRQRRVACSDVPTRNRSIQELRATGLDGLGDSSGQTGRRGRHVHEDHSRSRLLNEAGFAQVHVGHVPGEPHHRENHVGRIG